MTGTRKDDWTKPSPGEIKDNSRYIDHCLLYCHEVSEVDEENDNDNKMGKNAKRKLKRAEAEEQIKQKEKELKTLR